MWRPQGQGHAWCYSLTSQGTTLLARAEGLTPGTYRRLYGVLDDARRSGEHGLAYARGNLEHTDGINACYLAFLTAARARGGRLCWRGEWACTRTYTVPQRAGRERTATLRPDAELRYDGPGGPVRAFLEYDRATTAKARLAAKVSSYDAYRAASHEEGFVVLFVTPTAERGEVPLMAARTRARQERRPLLDVRVTTADDLFRHGPWERIWRDGVDAVHSLDVDVGYSLDS